MAETYGPIDRAPEGQSFVRMYSDGINTNELPWSMPSGGTAHVNTDDLSPIFARLIVTLIEQLGGEVSIPRQFPTSADRKIFFETNPLMNTYRLWIQRQDGTVPPQRKPPPPVRVRRRSIDDE